MTFVDLVYVTVALVLGLGLLVLVHEWGHFIMARRAGIRVEVFSIGFGRCLWSRKYGDTEYRLSLFPLGGYVKMTGEDPEDKNAAADPAAYANKPVWARIAVVLAGPAMNILLCMCLMPLTFLIGRERPAYEVALAVIDEVRPGSAGAVAGLLPGDRLITMDGRPVANWGDVQEAILLAGREPIQVALQRGESTLHVDLRANRLGFGFHPAGFLANRPIIDEVEPDSPAARAGLLPGDLVVSVAGMPVRYWDEVSLAFSRGRSLWFWWWVSRTTATPLPHEFLQGGALPVEVRRGNDAHRLLVTPQFRADYGRYLVGIRYAPEKAYEAIPKVLRRYGLVDALVLGEREVWRLVEVTTTFFVRLLRAPTEHYESLGGPVRIVGMFAGIAQEGFSPFLYFLAFFSLQLGLLNLFPIPVLDGGHLVFLLIEAVRRRPLTVRIQVFAQQIGLVLLASLFLFVTFNDLGHFEWAQKLLRHLGW